MIDLITNGPFCEHPGVSFDTSVKRQESSKLLDSAENYEASQFVGISKANTFTEFDFVKGYDRLLKELSAKRAADTLKGCCYLNTLAN